MSDNLSSDHLNGVWRFCATCGAGTVVDADGPHAWGLFFCAAHRGQMNSDQQRADRFARLERRPIGDQPTFTPTDRQRRRIAGARAYIAQRLTVAYSGQLDTGRTLGPRCAGHDSQSACTHAIGPHR